ncbi:DinB family protein [Stanieria cyanosphaera PCC 7437]|uniref:DinB family protein n=1 Tax=Stanieria cyanosphaera (strain ATCC 29371 / PCC 7437) TaxID=111780 RepID=K9XN34_STAC7|nr:DinB family protein [Stanieria cyanosphaera]AFZ34015.1 DinB family protein [Stanieria cyanosphaera PCC 7437]
MTNLKYYETMAQYNQWMNQKLYQICADIPDSKRKENLGAFFKSIHGTLNHLLYGDLAWMGRFLGKPFTITKTSEELYSDFEQLRQKREETDLQIIEWSKNLQPQWLEQPFKYTSNVDHQTRILPTWLLVTHMFNHQTHHRGQLTTLLSQFGYNPGITDLPWLPNNYF